MNDNAPPFLQFGFNQVTEYLRTVATGASSLLIKASSTNICLRRNCVEMIMYSSCFLKFNLTLAASKRCIHTQLSTAAPPITWQLTAQGVDLCFRPVTAFARGTRLGRGPHDIPTKPTLSHRCCVRMQPKTELLPQYFAHLREVTIKLRKESQWIDLSGAKMQPREAVLSPTPTAAAPELPKHTQPRHHGAARLCSTITSSSSKPILKSFFFWLHQKKMDDLSRLSTCITSKAAAYAEARRWAAQSRGDLEKGSLPSEVPVPADSSPHKALTLQQQKLQLIGKVCLIRCSWPLSQGPSGEDFSWEYSSSQGTFSITQDYMNSSVTQSFT